MSIDISPFQKSSSNKLDVMKKETTSLDEILRLGGAFLRTQTEQHNQTETELKQYGYTCFDGRYKYLKSI